MIHRRRLLQSGLCGFSAYAMQHACASAFADAIKASTRRCIVLWMDGGPSQLELSTRSLARPLAGLRRRSLPTSLGVQFAEHLPQLAEHASDLCLIRTLTSSEGEHERAKYVNHTGFAPIAAFPRPELGSLFAHQLHEDQLHRGELPGFITLGGPGFGPAYLGDEFAPFSVSGSFGDGEVIA